MGRQHGQAAWAGSMGRRHGPVFSLFFLDVYGEYPLGLLKTGNILVHIFSGYLKNGESISPLTNPINSFTSPVRGITIEFIVYT